MSSKFAKDLKAALKQAIAHKEGKLDLRTTEIEVPEPPAEYKAKEIKKIREKSHYSQGYFAKVLMSVLRQSDLGSLDSAYQVMPHCACLR